MIEYVSDYEALTGLKRENEPEPETKVVAAPEKAKPKGKSTAEVK